MNQRTLFPDALYLFDIPWPPGGHNKEWGIQNEATGLDTSFSGFCEPPSPSLSGPETLAYIIPPAGGKWKMFSGIPGGKCWGQGTPCISLKELLSLFNKHTKYDII